MRRGAGRAPAARGAADYLPGLLQAGVACGSVAGRCDQREIGGRGSRRGVSQCAAERAARWFAPSGCDPVDDRRLRRNSRRDANPSRARRTGPLRADRRADPAEAARLAFRQNGRRVVSRPGGADRRRAARSVGGKSVSNRSRPGGAPLGAAARTRRSAFATAKTVRGSLDALETRLSSRHRAVRLLGVFPGAGQLCLATRNTSPRFIRLICRILARHGARGHGALRWAVAFGGRRTGRVAPPFRRSKNALAAGGWRRRDHAAGSMAGLVKCASFPCQRRLREKQ